MEHEEHEEHEKQTKVEEAKEPETEESELKESEPERIVNAKEMKNIINERYKTQYEESKKKYYLLIDKYFVESYNNYVNGTSNEWKFYINSEKFITGFYSTTNDNIKKYIEEKLVKYNTDNDFIYYVYYCYFSSSYLKVVIAINDIKKEREDREEYEKYKKLKAQEAEERKIKSKQTKKSECLVM
jgi:hypothetical protein